MNGTYGGTQLCKAHSIVAKLCPYCEINRLREALESIANCNYKNATDFQEWAKDALKRVGDNQ